VNGTIARMPKPLLIDLFCGSFGWSVGWLELGGRVVGVDIDHQPYHGPVPHGANLILQDVRTIHGSQFKDASLIVASSPCQEFSYRAMPWRRARELGPPHLGMELFAQAFRIQREAIEAAGHFIPMVQENVRGAQKWVGRARWHYGSFYLWGDVPALMPITLGKGSVKVNTMGAGWYPPGHPKHVRGLGFNTHADRQLRSEEEGVKVGDVGWRRDNDVPSQTFIDAAASGVKIGGPRGDDWFTHHNRPEFEDRATKNSGGSWFNIAHNTTSGTGQNPDGRLDGVKNKDADGYERDHPDAFGWKSPRTSSSNVSARKAASAAIAKIPLPLARHIARVYFPRETGE
jgi:hypothetical protein